MKHLVSTRRIQLLAAVSLALVILPVIEAEPRCPGNVASVTPQFVQHALIVIPVRINQSGPFDFMVDTGQPGYGHRSIAGRGTRPQASRQGRPCFRCQRCAGVRNHSG